MSKYAESLVERYYQLKESRDTAIPQSSRNLRCREKMADVIDRARRAGLATEFLAGLLEVCPYPAKVSYADRESAIAYANERMDYLWNEKGIDTKLHPYRCKCGSFHLSSSTAQGAER